MTTNIGRKPIHEVVPPAWGQGMVVSYRLHPAATGKEPQGNRIGVVLNDGYGVGPRTPYLHLCPIKPITRPNPEFHVELNERRIGSTGYFICADEFSTIGTSYGSFENINDSAGNPIRLPPSVVLDANRRLCHLLTRSEKRDERAAPDGWVPERGKMFWAEIPREYDANITKAHVVSLTDSVFNRQHGYCLAARSFSMAQKTRDGRPVFNTRYHVRVNFTDIEPRRFSSDLIIVDWKQRIVEAKEHQAWEGLLPEKHLVEIVRRVRAISDRAEHMQLRDEAMRNHPEMDRDWRSRPDTARRLAYMNPNP